MIFSGGIEKQHRAAMGYYLEKKFGICQTKQTNKNVTKNSDEIVIIVIAFPRTIFQAFINCMQSYDRTRSVHVNGVTRTRKFLHSIDFSM